MNIDINISYLTYKRKNILSDALFVCCVTCVRESAGKCERNGASSKTDNIRH